MNLVVIRWYCLFLFFLFFFFNDTATTEIYTLSLHDALPISQARNSMAKPRMYQAAFHLVATARPRNTPAASCHLRRPRRGPPGRPGWRATSSASRAREVSRSIRMQPNAARTKNIRKMSRIPVLDSTNSSPSSDISSPATQPSSVERVIRRAIRQISKMASEPNTALANRQPNGFSPNSHSPTAISSLPTSGWTTYSPHAEVWSHGEEEVRVPGHDH